MVEVVDVHLVVVVGAPVVLNGFLVVVVVPGVGVPEGEGIGGCACCPQVQSQRS